MSDDLTVGALKVEMARLLSCEASEVMLESEGTMLGTDSSKFGNDRVLSSIELIRCRQLSSLGGKSQHKRDVSLMEGDLEVSRGYERSQRRRLR